jgi:tetratricopeptide (TPR) repeat protein
MKRRSGSIPETLMSVCSAGVSRGLQVFSANGQRGKSGCSLLVLAALLAVSTQAAVPRQAPSARADGVTIQGVVRNAAGQPVAGATVRIEQKGVPGLVETRTDAAGSFAFSALGIGTYILSAEKSELRSRTSAVIASSPGERRQVELVLEDQGTVHADAKSSSPSLAQAMEFADKPNFTVAGVTDWTAAGGHGSDSSLRTSEALTRETLKLKSASEEAATANSSAGSRATKESENRLRAALASAPESFEANRQMGEFYLRAHRSAEALPFLQSALRLDPANRDNENNLALALQEAGNFAEAREHVRKLLAQGESADLRRMAGELDEKLGDPLAAVHQFEQAVRQDPSERNYFEWGSELLLHRAVWQAREVFEKGAQAYPQSARMLTALGAALFAGALYDEAALRLCDASDLNPADPEPYLFMGKIEVAAPNPLACVEQKLARFVAQQPGNALANYFYAMALLKQRGQSVDPKSSEQVEAMLTKAVTLDAQCADAYLELGILSSSRREYEKAIGFYISAIQANPQLSAAHYRLGVAYDRIGERAKASQEFQMHDEIEKQLAATVEHQRREVKQFLVVAPGEPAEPAVH